jgi:hypothetical protein
MVVLRNMNKGGCFMFCPVCDEVRMKEVEKEGVLIDICPSCKGVWLDRGELDKLLQEARAFREPFNQWYEGYAPHDTYIKGSHHDYHKHYGHKHKKKRSFFDMFEDIFD